MKCSAGWGAFREETHLGASREQIRERDGWRCARCGSSRDLHVHHRKLRSQGGREDASNLVTLCADCHRWAHGHPGEAAGWIVRSHEDPAMIGVSHVMWPAGPVLIRDDLTFLPWTEGGWETEREITW